MPTSRIYIDRDAFKQSTAEPQVKPPCVVDVEGEEPRKAHELVLRHDGVEVARLVYNPKRLQPSGAAVWVETDCDVELITWPDRPVG